MQTQAAREPILCDQLREPEHGKPERSIDQRVGQQRDRPAAAWPQTAARVSNHSDQFGLQR